MRGGDGPPHWITEGWDNNLMRSHLSPTNMGGRGHKTLRAMDPGPRRGDPCRILNQHVHHFPPPIHTNQQTDQQNWIQTDGPTGLQMHSDGPDQLVQADWGLHIKLQIRPPDPTELSPSTLIHGSPAPTSNWSPFWTERTSTGTDIQHLRTGSNPLIWTVLDHWTWPLSDLFLTDWSWSSSTQNWPIWVLDSIIFFIHLISLLTFNPSRFQRPEIHSIHYINRPPSRWMQHGDSICNPRGWGRITWDHSRHHWHHWHQQDPLNWTWPLQTWTNWTFLFHPIHSWLTLWLTLILDSDHSTREDNKIQRINTIQTPSDSTIQRYPPPNWIHITSTPLMRVPLIHLIGSIHQLTPINSDSDRFTSTTDNQHHQQSSRLTGLMHQYLRDVWLPLNPYHHHQTENSLSLRE